MHFFWCRGFPFHVQGRPPKGVVVGRGGEPRPTALAGGACPACWPAAAEAPTGRGNPEGADRGQRAGGAGVLAWRDAPWKGGGRTPVILNGGPPTDPAFTNVNLLCCFVTPPIHICKQAAPAGALERSPGGKRNKANASGQARQPAAAALPQGKTPWCFCSRRSGFAARGTRRAGEKHEGGGQ